MQIILLLFNTPTTPIKKQDGGDLTQLWQCAHIYV